MKTPKKELRKATPDEKKMYKAAKRDIKGKSVKGYSERKALGTVSSGSVGGRGSKSTQGTASSAPSVKKVQAGREAKRESFLTETKKGQKLQSMEQKAMSKGKTNYSTPQFQAGNDYSAPMPNKTLDKLKKK